VGLSEGGVNDAETCSNNVRLYLFTYGAFIPTSPISASPSLRPTLCERCVVNRVSERFRSQ